MAALSNSPPNVSLLESRRAAEDAARMIEELMEAASKVQMIEAQSQPMLANMDPQLAAVLKPLFEVIIDGMIRPIFEKQYAAACHRQEIQEELTAFESGGTD